MRGKYAHWLLVFFLILNFLFIPNVDAAAPDSARDTLSDSRKATQSEHSIIIDQSASTAINAGDTISLTFHAGFTVPALVAADISLTDGITRTILDSCSAGTDNIGVAVSGQVITLTACAGFSPGTSGATITIRIGIGATKITNPGSSGIYSVVIAGSYGDDPKNVNVAITEAVTVSLTIPFPNGDVRFTGDAFPNALVTILDGPAVAGTTVANSTSYFDKTISGLSPTTHTFGIYAQALDGRKTLTLSFNITVLAGMTITVSGILLPTIITVPVQEKRPKSLIQSGIARHNSQINTFTSGPTALNHQTNSNSSGEWQISVPQVLHLGGHSITAIVSDGLGGQSIPTNPTLAEILLSADLNIDNLVSLTDFSMLMFSYGLANPPNAAADINDNGGPVDLVDFSVMMFYWTGG
jgi:hypothetical protein